MLAILGADVPRRFVAVTVNEYATPLERPWITQDKVAVVHAFFSGLEVAVYINMGDPPSNDEVVHDTTADPWIATALTRVGAVGGESAGTNTATDGDDRGELPISLVAKARNVYEVPPFSPTIWQLFAMAKAVQVSP